MARHEMSMTCFLFTLVSIHRPSWTRRAHWATAAAATRRVRKRERACDVRTAQWRLCIANGGKDIEPIARQARQHCRVLAKFNNCHLRAAVRLDQRSQRAA